MTGGDLGARAAQSSTRPDPWPRWAWVLTFVSYVFLGYHLKSIVLNWIVGPLYPLLVMYLIPNLVRRVLGRSVEVPPFTAEGEAG